MKRILPTLALLIPLTVAACDRGGPPAQAGVVDSVFPMDVALDRFRADLAEPEALTSGAATRDELVRGVVEALVVRDTAAFVPLAVSRAEWAWLYFPTSTVAKPPYELPPALAWFQLQEKNRQGVLRALRELGGHALGYREYSCDLEPTVEGSNRVWSGCVVSLTRDGEPVTLKLFGAIVERDGRFAILSYANDF